MPSGFAALDTGFPDLSGMKSTDQQIKAVEDYLYQLMEQLRWTLNHLDQSNFNETEVIGWLGDVIEEPVRIAIQSITDGLITRLDIDEGKISTLTAKTGINELGEDETLYSRIDQTAENITTTVASATHQYDTGAYVIDYYGYGAPTGTAANGKKYLDQETGDWYTSNGSTWSKSGTFPLSTSASSLVSTINQGAGKIESSVVKIDNNTTLASYVTQTDQAIQSRVTQTDMQTALTQTAGEIMLDVHGEYADEWTSGHSYYKDDVVKITTRDANNKVTAVAFYKAKSNHTSSNSNKPPNATYWTVVSAPNVQTIIDASLDGITLSYDNTGVSADNASHITLSKDGIEIAANTIQMTNIVADSVSSDWVYAGNVEATQIQAGTLDAGVVYSGTISADNITTGTLDADDITIGGQFNVERSNGNACGWIGGGQAYIPDYLQWHDAMAMGSADDTISTYIAVSNGATQNNIVTGSAMLRDRDAVIYATASTEQTLGVWGVAPYCVMETRQGEKYVAVTQSGIRSSDGIHTGSDRRIKTDIRYDLTEYERLFDALRPCSYLRKESEGEGYHLGFIAQDVEESLENSGISDSAIVGRCPEAKGFSQEDPLLTLSYNDFTALQTHMIQKLMERMDALEKKLEGFNAP